MKDPFHEAKIALDTVKREFTSVSSLNTIAAYAIPQACENAIRSLWTVATAGSEFPHEYFKPYHKPANYVDKLGLREYYSGESQKFLDRLTGYALDEARFEGSEAYVEHTN